MKWMKISHELYQPDVDLVSKDKKNVRTLENTWLKTLRDRALCEPSIMDLTVLLGYVCQTTYLELNAINENFFSQISFFDSFTWSNFLKVTAYYYSHSFIKLKIIINSCFTLKYVVNNIESYKFPKIRKLF